MFLDYEILRLIWWLLLGVLLIGFAIMDGFDLGVGALLPFVARTDTERRVLINTVGPVWEGNQVWFILGGGAIFAAWPPLYAVSFSGFYMAMFLVLLALILRPVGFKFRSKIDNPTWRSVWDWALFIGGFVPSLIFGVAVGNVLLGVPFSFDETLRIAYTGNLFGLLNPFALLCGLVSLTMLLMHGGVFIGLKTRGITRERGAKAATYSAMVMIVLFALAGVWVVYGIEGYVISGAIEVAGPSNPLNKVVVQEPGAWINNYHAHPWMLAAPVLGFGGALMTVLAMRGQWFGMAFITSALSVFGVVATAGVSLFPFLLPSSTHPGSSLTVWDASSSHFTLFVMLIATVIFMPLILAYTAWVYRVLRGPVTPEYVQNNEESVY